MIENHIQVCVILRHFKSDSSYLALEDESWIQELTDEDRKQLTKDLRHFNNYPYDQHIAARWYYAGSRKRFSVLQDNTFIFFRPLFTALKLFKTGQLLMPVCFYCCCREWRDMPLHGEENYGAGYGLEMGKRPYEFNAVDVQPFQSFWSALKPYLRFLNLGVIPYHKPPKLFIDIDTRCLFATHLLLDKSGQSDNNFLLFDWVLAYTNGLESLYLLQSDRLKANTLAARVSVVLGQNVQDENRLRNLIIQFYKIRNSIVHGSLLDNSQDDFVQKNIWEYQDILRKSILAFLNLNERNQSKEKVINLLQEAISQPSLRKSIRDSLKLLNLAK